jgi:putative drug exporter of the RND superfamily
VATFLCRLGRGAFRRRRIVLLLWTAALVAVGFGAVKAPAADDGGTSFMPGIEAQRAFDLIGERFPGADADGATARVVFIAPDGQKVTASHMRTVIDGFVTEAGKGAQVAGVVSPFRAGAVSEDVSTAYATVTYTVAAGDLTDADKDALEHAVDDARDAGLTVEAGGTVVSGRPEAGGPAEGIGVAVAAIVLLITFGSLAAAGLPLLTALVGVGLSMAGIIALGGTFGLSLTTGTLASMLGLAVGIDYALFVVSRYREERSHGRDPQEATGLAVGTAGSAVVFAGLTVIIALAGLSAIGVPMLTKMGLCAAAAVAVGVLVALALVPALLGLWPDAVLARGVRRNRSGSPGRQDDGDNGGSRWARFVVRRPLTVLLVCVTGLGALALPAASLELGMPGDEAKPVSTTERRAYDALDEGFGAGFNGPLTIVVDADGVDDPKAAATAIAAKLDQTDGVVSVSAARFNPAGDTALLTAVPGTGRTTSTPRTSSRPSAPSAPDWSGPPVPPSR